MFPVGKRIPQCDDGIRETQAHGGHIGMSQRLSI